uniref:FYVE-type zinc finger domain-containing protein n=1 Tax=Anopheles atroparvus TaxID=41427 RepID=A0AAG5DGY1_ANOAO
MLPADLFLGVPGSTMKLTPGVGMTLLIGVAGSFFLVAQSHRLLRSKLSQRRRSSRKPDVAECYMCNANIELESTDSFATCRGCERLVCRGENCCQWVESIGIWECTGCQSNRVIQQKAGEWLLNQLTARLQQPGPVELKEGNLLGLGLDSEDARSTTSSTVSVNQRIKVREFIEELLSSMLHGPLDDVSVGQLMKHESYLPLWEGQQQHHSPSDQHFELKRLIQKILEEIAKLPELLNHSGLPLRPEEHLPYFDPKKYEQLVATAVLNKVVDDYRNPKNFTNAGDVAAKPYAVGGGAVDLNHNQLTEGGGSHHTGALNAEALRQMSVTADDLHAHEAASYSATGDRRLSDTDESYLSDYIQRHKVPLPDLSDTTTGSGSGAEDDDLQSLKSNATDGTWEENWLFRKRQLKTTESSIAMLVPSPTEEVKALIGDKNADEISDLSEAGSDCEGYESDSNVAPVGGVTAGELNPPTARSSSKDETSEGLSSSSKQQDSLEEDHLPADSLVSISSLPGNEEVLSEAKNSQLVAEQERSSGGGKHQSAAGGSLIEDLISIEPVAEKVETTNPTLTNPFFDDPFEVNNSVITDDVKLLQRTETSDIRSTTAEPCTNGHGDRKEVPIDRAAQQQQHHTHSNICPSNPVADSVVEPVVTGRSVEDRPSSSEVVADSAKNGSGARETNLTNNANTGENTNQTERLNTPVPPLLLLMDSLSPPGSPVQQVLSPHPIMMTITDVFDRMASSAPLAAISEELPPAAMLLDVGDSQPTGVASMDDSFDQYSSPLSTISEELPPTGEMETNDEAFLLIDDTAGGSTEDSLASLVHTENDQGLEGSISEELPVKVLPQRSDEAVPMVDTTLGGKTEPSSPTDSQKALKQIESTSEQLPAKVTMDTCDQNVPLLDITLGGVAEDAITSPMNSEKDLQQKESTAEELPPDCTSTEEDPFATSPIRQMSEESMPAPVHSKEDQEPVELASEQLLGPTGLTDSTSTEDVPLVSRPVESVTSLGIADDDKEPVEPVRTTSEAILSPMDSFQDDSEYRTVSEATNNSLILVESFEELDPFSVSDMPQEPNGLQHFEDEFSSLVEKSESENTEIEDTQEPTVAVHSSPDFLQIRETAAAHYVRNLEEIEFAEQLKPMNAPCVVETSKRNPFEEENNDTDKPTQITLHADLVTFDNNAPSPERNPGIAAVTQQMRAYCEELKCILNRPSVGKVGQEMKPSEEESEQWEMVEAPELATFGDELEQAEVDPTVTEVRPCKDHAIRVEPLLELDEPFPSVIEIGNIRMAEYSESLKNIEYVEEAIVMEEQAEVLPDATLEMEEGTSVALSVSSPEPSHHIVAVKYTPSAEDPPSQIASENDVPSIADEATESSQGSCPTPRTTPEETLLESIESQSESKIDDTSMPFSDSDLPSLSSPFTSTTGNVTTTTAINNCMPTNITDQVTTPSISTSTIEHTDTNPSNNTRFGSELSADAPPSPFVADCSIIPAQSTAEQQAAVSNGGHHGQPLGQPPSVDAGLDEQNKQSLDDAGTLIPGSIAEREHLKWRNAKPIANNPYSPDALQRRLSEKSRPSSMIELDRLVKKDAAPNGAAVVLMDDEDRPKEPVDSGTENDRSLQSVMGGGLSEKKKIGREYYINDPERLRAGGGVVKQTLGMEQKQQQQQQQLSHSTDDEKSLLLGRNVDDGESNQLKVATPTGTTLSRSSSFGKPQDPNAENIFAARPIQVTTDDPILRKGTKVNHLSMAAREIFLIPLEQDPNGSLVSSSSEVSINSPSSSGARPELDSLTYSEDSDVTRIYDLTTGESKVIRSGVPSSTAETILQILPQQPSPVNRPSVSPAPFPASPKPPSPVGGQDERTFLRTAQFVVKPLSPETIKFFAPKRKLSFTGSNSNLAATGGPGQTMHSSLHIDFPATRAPNGSEFSIIEKDVIDVLPSVKELAKCYSGSCSEVSTMPPKPLYKPRDFLRQSSDVLNEEGSSSMPDAGTKGHRQYSSTSSIAVRDEIREIRKINLDAYRQQSTFYPMAPGHSITARSLSKQIREHKTNVTDDHKVGQHEELPGSNGRNGGGGGGGDGNQGGDVLGDEVNAGHASPERPSSPVFLPGHLKSSIEFFESLRNNP